MKRVKFYGASDDLFEAEGDYKNEICNSNDDSTMGYNITLGPPADNVGLIVAARYADFTGSWMVGIIQLDEFIPLPNWPIRLSHEAISVALEIDLPDDAVITAIGEDEDDD